MPRATRLPPRLRHGQRRPRPDRQVPGLLQCPAPAFGPPRSNTGSGLRLRLAKLGAGGIKRIARRAARESCPPRLSVFRREGDDRPPLWTTQDTTETGGIHLSRPAACPNELSQLCRTYQTLATNGLPTDVIDILSGFYQASRQDEFAVVDPALGKLLGREPEPISSVIAAELNAISIAN